MTRPRSIAVALEATGWHPASWRDPSARPAELFTPEYWTELVQLAERGGVDYVTIEDALGIQSASPAAPDDRGDQVRGRLDALLIASYVAPATSRIGLVPTVTTTHTEPFHVGTWLQTLDHISRGRAGWRVQVSPLPQEAAHFGRRTLPPLDVEAILAGDTAQVQPLFDEARDAVEVVRRLFDSWQDDAIIREEATGRFIDRERVHYIEFTGEFFSVKGSSIVPRSPQGQPFVTALAHGPVPYRLAATSADAVFVTPQDDTDAERILAEVRTIEQEVGRTGAPLRVVGDLVVLLEPTERAAADALARLDALAGAPLSSDARILAGTPEALIEQAEAWFALGLDGLRIRPARLPRDLELLTEAVIPALRPPAAGATLREREGLERPASRYATVQTAGHETAPANEAKAKEQHA